MTRQHDHYYAAHSYMGLNYTYDSPCWMVYAFDTPQGRDHWVEKNEYNQDTGNLVAQAVYAKEAYKIAPDLRNNPPDKASRVTHLYWDQENKEWVG